MKKYLPVITIIIAITGYFIISFLTNNKTEKTLRSKKDKSAREPSEITHNKHDSQEEIKPALQADLANQPENSNEIQKSFKITGKVTDHDGNPLNGISLGIKIDSVHGSFQVISDTNELGEFIIESKLNSSTHKTNKVYLQLTSPYIADNINPRIVEENGVPAYFASLYDKLHFANVQEFEIKGVHSEFLATIVCKETAVLIINLAYPDYCSINIDSEFFDNQLAPVTYNVYKGKPTKIRIPTGIGGRIIIQSINHFPEIIQLSDFTANKPHVLNISLKNSNEFGETTFTGFILDKEGRAIANACVSAQQEAADGVFIGYYTKTGPDGKFTLQILNKTILSLEAHSQKFWRNELKNLSNLNDQISIVLDDGNYPCPHKQ
ncbi:MAG: hypothetical protein HY606_09755 [Planctomycetes bacterium]|nr:hypothetical protein [Planctomycetota bacterium]